MKKLIISTKILQGSSLFPILYLSYNTDFINKYIQLDPNIKASGFIDNVMLLIIKKSLKAIYNYFFSAHQVCFKWAKTYGSKFTSKKYQLIYFTRCHKDKCECKLDLRESGIMKRAKVGRLLGILVYNKLSWRPYIESINTKVLFSLGELLCLAESISEKKIILI